MKSFIHSVNKKIGERVAARMDQIARLFRWYKGGNLNFHLSSFFVQIS